VASIFTKIIRGELPGRFVWRDERAVAFLTIEPLKPGHTLVVPIEEVEHWIDLDPELMAHLTVVAHHVASAIDRAFGPSKVGLMIAGLEVPHVHLHLVPIWKVHDLDFARADRKASSEGLDDAAERIRAELRAAGRSEVN